MGAKHKVGLCFVNITPLLVILNSLIFIFIPLINNRMSVLYEDENAAFISHEKYISNVYARVEKNSNILSYEPNEALFDIKYPYVSSDRHKRLVRKKRIGDNVEEYEELRRTIEFVKSTYDLFKSVLIRSEIFRNDNADGKELKKNKKALDFSDVVYRETSECNVEGIIGGNNRDTAVNVEINGREFLFPRNCGFYCCNVSEIGTKLGFETAYDLIVIDPPWWNKYIRRKRKKSRDAYDMMYNSELLDIPVGSLIHDDSLVAVWCTNAKSNLKSLRDEIFKKWGVRHKATWFWLKITTQSEPVCNFSDPPGKQPFEQILFATRSLDRFSSMTDRKIVVSVPSALHSNKPPLNEILKEFLPVNPKCLEIFARYLLPNTISYGLEAIKFQHIALYKEKKTC